MADTKGITVKKADDIASWYQEVCIKSQIAEFGEIKGTITIRPRGYYMWEKVQKYFADTILSDLQVDNAYFPLFIPERFFKKEAEHAQGFAPELAWAQTATDTGEEDKAIIRPTSETIIVDSFRRWLRNYKELPIKVNQWANVVRWEVKQTKLFLRGREFLWQEGHCIYETEDECRKDVRAVLDHYANLAQDLLAIPSLKGRKTKAETFPGAVDTYTFESLMPDGKALQMGTSHYLGQGFMKAFDVQYMGSDEKKHFPHYNSWGISTRLLGAVVMTHSDDKGLVLPPRLVKQKVLIIPLARKDSSEQVLEYAKKIQGVLGEYNASIDESKNSLGFKLGNSELYGVPITLIIGQQEMDEQKVTLKVRDLDSKQSVSFEDLPDFVEQEIDEMHDRLFKKAQTFLQSRIEDASSLDDVKRILSQGKLARAFFIDDKDEEEKLGEQIPGLTSRCIDESNVGSGKCIATGKETKTMVYFAKSY